MGRTASEIKRVNYKGLDGEIAYHEAKAAEHQNAARVLRQRLADRATKLREEADVLDAKLKGDVHENRANPA